MPIAQPYNPPANLLAVQDSQGSLLIDLTWTDSVYTSDAPDLLLHMDGQNGTTTFTDSSLQAFTVTPTNVTISTAAPRFGAGCANFSGGNGYLSAPITTGSYNDLQAATKWTVEGWFMIPASGSLSGKLNMLFSDYSASGATQYIRIYINGNSYSGYADSVQLSCAGGGTTASGPNNIPINDGAWHHFAVCANATTGQCQVFVDGYSGTVVNTYTGFGGGNPNPNLYIGTDYGTINGTDGNWFNGYIDDVRITRDQLYSGNFFLPTKAFTSGLLPPGYDVYRNGVSVASYIGGNSYQDTVPSFATYTYNVAAWGYKDSNTSLLVHFDGIGGDHIFPDYSGNNWGLNPTTVAIEASQTKFGNGALSCGTGGTLTMFSPGSSLDLTGGGDFTVEFWFYATGFINSASMFSIGVPGSTGFTFTFDSSGRGPQVLSNSTTVGPASLVAPSAGWHHVALVVASGTAKLYLDGTGGTAVGSWAATQASSGLLTIGAKPGGSFNTFANTFVGYIDELRISKTARYTSNFTPAGPFSAATADLSYQSSTFTKQVTNLYVVPQCVFVPAPASFKANIASNLAGAPAHIYSAPDYTTVQAK